MSPDEVKKALGEFYSNEKEDLRAVADRLHILCETTKITEETIIELNNAEKEIAFLREKYTERLIRLLKAGYII